MNTKAELLTGITDSKKDLIAGMGTSAENLLDSFLHSDLHLKDLEMTCSFDGKFLQFTSDYPEKQDDLDTRVEIEEAVEFIKNKLNYIYQNEQLQPQNS